jgi:hypothetical protein
MSIFERLRKEREDRFNRSRLRLERFLLVCRLKPSDRCFAGPPRGGDFFVDDLRSMSITPIIFVLIILLFGFDSSVSSAFSALRRFFEIL